MRVGDVGVGAGALAGLRVLALARAERAQLGRDGVI